MKLRQLPEDFRVEEVSGFSIKRSGSYRLYLLEKMSLETFSLLSYLSRKTNIPRSEFGIAGLKDRHAVTKQYITVPAKYDLKTTQEENFSLKHIGYVDRPIRLGDLRGNKFEITVRSVRKGELDGIKQKAENIREVGVPNYFDSQRFGSVIFGEFVAKHLIRKEYEKAVKIYLTQFPKTESAKVKEDKRNILQHWNDLSKARPKSKALADVVDEYLRTKDWLSAYKRIPSNLREIMVSAYQSYLWNECVKELLRKFVDNKYLYKIDYNIGKLLYFKRLSDKEANSMPKTFRTISHDITPTDLESYIISKVLSKEGITLKDFDIRHETDNFFKVHERLVILKPADFSVSEPLIDEVNDHGKNSFFKIIVSFTLPKGSYATVVTKRLFNA